MRFVSWTDIMKRRKQKLVLVFDEENRKEFLTGFRKRKNARRKKALEENRVKIEENRRKLREEKQNSLKQHIQEYRENTETPSDNESLENEEDVLYDFGQHTVTVSTINCEGRAKDPLTYTPTVTSREKLEVDEDATAVQSNGKGIMDKLKRKTQFRKKAKKRKIQALSDKKGTGSKRRKENTQFGVEESKTK